MIEGLIYKMKNIVKIQKLNIEFLDVSTVICEMRVNNNLSLDKLINWLRRECGDTLNEKLILKNCDALLIKLERNQGLKGLKQQLPFSTLG